MLFCYLKHGEMFLFAILFKQKNSDDGKIKEKHSSKMAGEDRNGNK